MGILYHMITGGYPFDAPLTPRWVEDTRRLIRNPSLKYQPSSSLRSVSSKCVNLLDQLLRKDMSSRPDAPACLQHAWFDEFEPAPPVLSCGVAQCLEAYSWQPELKKALFLLIAHQSTAPALQELRVIFTHFDEHNRGALDSDIFREVLRRT